MIKTTTAVNDLASESHHNYKVATKKDLLRKDLEIEHLQRLVVDLVQKPVQGKPMPVKEPLMSPRELVESVGSQQLIDNYNNAA